MRKLFYYWPQALFCFFFFPGAFVRQATDEAIAGEFETNEQLRKKYPTRELPPEDLTHFRQGREEQTSALRRSVLSSLVTVLALAAAAWLSSSPLAGVSGSTISGLRTLSAALILWAVLGRLGWNIQTFQGDTLPERFNSLWFRLIYVTGAYLLVLSMFLSMRRS
jgi:hypothetical protein